MKPIQKKDIEILCDYLGYKPAGLQQEMLEAETIVVMSGDKKVYTNYKELKAMSFEKLMAV